MSVDIRKAFSLAAARADIRYPHGTDADNLAGILREAIGDLSREIPTVGSVLAEFVKWAERADDGDEGCDYLNGDAGGGRDGWEDLRELADEARVVLAKIGLLA